MTLYRKKPITIEAKQVFEQADHYQLVDVWISTLSDLVIGVVTPLWTPQTPHRVGMGIKTLEGWHEVTPGDWIIRGVNGGYCPCKPDIFAATYEAVEAPKAAQPSPLKPSLNPSRHSVERA
jgi:hypothetical protein